MRNLFGMVPVEATPQRNRDGQNGGRSEEPFQTLHGLFSSGCLLLLLFVIPIDVTVLMREVDSNRTFRAKFLGKCCQNHTGGPVLGRIFIVFNDFRRPPARLDCRLRGAIGSKQTALSRNLPAFSATRRNRAMESS